jgi:anion-transporting  ArsA/GET3 family ATPase
VSTLDSASLVVVCGSGGVGKTTISAALGVRAALRDGKKVLVLTVDPARRLADALGLVEIGNKVVQVDLGDTAGELHIGMIDTKASWDDLVVRVAPSPDVAAKVTGNSLYRNLTERFVHSHDYIAMERLFDAHERGGYDLVVVDTPPSRNAIDVLDAPQRMLDFFGSKLLKFLTVPTRSIVSTIAAKPFFLVANRILGAGFLGEVTNFFTLFRTMETGFVERNKRVMEVLRSNATSFVVVTTLENGPLHEARFLLGALRERNFGIGAVVANRAIDPHVADEVQRVLDTHDERAMGDVAQQLLGGSDRASTIVEIVRRHATEMVGNARVQRERLMTLSAAAEVDQVWLSPLRGADITDLNELRSIEFRPV